MRTTTIVGIALIAAGCGHSAPTILDADYGRLQPEQTGSVDAARAELARANEELEAARSKLAEGSREQKLAEADRDAAKAEQKRVQKLVDAAEARASAAEAREDYAEKLTEARKAAADAAQRRIDLAAAKVELLKLQALEQAKMTTTKQYDQKEFYGRVAESQKKLDESREKVKSLEQDAGNSQRRWDDLQRKVPAAE